MGLGAIDPGWKFLDVDHVRFVELYRCYAGITSKSFQAPGRNSGREAK
jgi:hypothetical protein